MNAMNPNNTIRIMNTRNHLIIFTAATVLAACSSDDALTPQQPATPVEAGEIIGFQASVGQPLEVLDEEDMDAGNPRLYQHLCC